MTKDSEALLREAREKLDALIRREEDQRFWGINRVTLGHLEKVQSLIASAELALTRPSSPASEREALDGNAVRRVIQDVLGADFRLPGFHANQIAAKVNALVQPSPASSTDVAGLAEVLQPFADVAAFLDAPDDTYAEWPDHYGLGEVEAGQLPVTIGDFREARAALERLTSQPSPASSTDVAGLAGSRAPTLAWADFMRVATNIEKAIERLTSQPSPTGPLTLDETIALAKRESASLPRAITGGAPSPTGSEQ